MSNKPGRNGTDVAKLWKVKTTNSQTQAEERKRSPLIVKSTIRYDVSYSVLVKKPFSIFNFPFRIVYMHKRTSPPAPPHKGGGNPAFLLPSPAGR
jgi:hypothetical protein